MKSVVIHAAQDLRIDTVADPRPAAGEVIVAMEWGGICGSDVSYWRNGASGTATLSAPLTLGHEVAGRIAEIGPGVSAAAGKPDWRVGDPVTAHPATANGGYFGSAALRPHTHGGFSEYRAIPAGQLRRLPAGVDTQRGSLAEPLAVAMHAVSRPGPVAGRRVLVNGAGPIGALVVAAAKFAGAASVTAVDVEAGALKIAGEMGADSTIDVSNQPIPTGFDLIFEASGAVAALTNVLHAVARGGTVVQVGNLPGTPAPVVLGDLVSREVTWMGSFRFVDEISAAVAAIRDGLDVSPLITHTFGIDDAQAAIETAADRRSGSSKVLLNLASSRS